MKVFIPVGAPQKGLLASIGIELENRGHKVIFVALNAAVKKALLSVSKDIDPRSIEVESEFSPAPYEDIICECAAREKKYGERFAMLSAYDRALGRGYIFNADNYPNIIRSWWPKEAKYEEILKKVLFYEYLFDKHQAKLIIGVGQYEILSLLSRYYNAHYFMITPPRFGSQYMWVNNEFDQNFKMIQLVRKYVNTNEGEGEDIEKSYNPSELAAYFFNRDSYSVQFAIKKVLRQSVSEIYRRVRGHHKKNSYSFLGWNKVLMQKPHIHSYLSKYGKKSTEFIGKKVVVFPLQFEPEASLLCISPELNNSMELIAWISKSLPADAYLVVKEHPYCLGVRPSRYYDNFRRMANVVLAHPEESSLAWLKVSSLVAAITGTMGFEAVRLHKPVLSFGKYQIINELPTVRYANSFDTTRTAIEDLMDIPVNDKIFSISNGALKKAYEELSFDISGYEKIFKSTQLHPGLAIKAIDNLYSHYSDVMKE